MDKVLEKIDRWKRLGDIFLTEDKNVFIKEINGDLHFCKIILIGEETLLIQNYAPKQRADIKETLYWLNIEEFDEVRE